jgi:hypothetical protein
MTAQFSFEISFVSAATLTNVETLGLPAPRSTWQAYSEQVQRQDGGALGVGWASASWAWDYMTAAQWAIFRALMTAASRDCWVRTLTDAGTYKYYTGIAIFPPPPYQQRAGRTLQIELRLVNLVEYTP